ncbi:Jmjd1a protein [Coprinopsis sp. MPI-PUGE-AT-0042]|nr:Jmjd1a protein [Coprinopsis sp. MPI-PUGE-AT-0042]
MTSMHDAAKKPSIDALLNSQPASHQIPGTGSAHGVQHSAQPHPQYSYHAATFGSASSFPLKAASWFDPASTAVAAQRSATGHHRHRSDPHQTGYMPGAYVYTSPGVEPMGGQFPARVEMTPARWPSHPTSQPLPTSHPRQSEAGGANGMPSQSQLDVVQSASPKLTSTSPVPARKVLDAYDFSVSDYQPSERVSVRLAARDLGPYSQYPNGRQGSQGRSTPQPQTLYLPNHSSSQSGQRRTSSKRQLSEEEANESAPKPKRTSKPKPKSTTGRADESQASSKRGFNSKKRVEAAQSTVQGEQALPSVAFSTDEGREGDRLPFPTTAQGGPAHKIKCERQYARCMSTKYKNDKFPRCVSCTRRWAGDTCRFQGIRYLLRNTEDNTIHAVAFTDRAEVPTLQFNDRWNIDPTMKHITRIKRVIANALLPTLRVDRHHLTLPELVKRTRESEVRITCDSCMTSIFSTSWFCRLCGREACPDCYAQVKDLTYVAPDAPRSEVNAMRARREKFALSNPFFLSCNKRIDHEAWHFSPMSRFVETEIDETISEMERLQNEAGPSTESASTVTDGRSTAITNPPSMPTVPPAPFTLEGDGERSWSEVYLVNQTKASYLPPHLAPSGAAGVQYVPPNIEQTAAIVPSLEPYRYTDAEVSRVDSTTKFAKIWEHGEPLVVANILNKFKIDWSPQYFIDQFGDRQCLITECEEDQNKQTTISEFFSTFGKYEGRTGVWKLKDWPPSADFKTTFPQLFEDFSNAVPVPDYVRRDGVYNIASHFPTNAVAPDLGPKMYNAYAGKQGLGSKGSTRLHMDMADALNVMLYSADCPDGSPGCALWDIFRACDSDKIRTFLRKTHNLAVTHSDPIHGQQFYLDDDMRLRLHHQFGVKSYRIYQRPGEAIFIPAGCAHQVLNMSDSIKIAIDYVSPENIDRCAQLTREFREQNKAKVWKEDILQLKAMMWFAWQSCRNTERQLAPN